MKAELELPPIINEVEAAPAVRQESRSLWSWLWKALVGFWKYLIGVIFCQSLFGSILVVGWTYRLMQRSIWKCWWKRSAHAKEGAGFSTYLPRHDLQRSERHWPNWFAGQNFISAIQRVPGTSLWNYLLQLMAAPFHSLWLNLKIGLAGMFNIWVFTLPGCVLWLFAWYDGWNNSFNKGYEQAPVGPLTGLLGIALCIAAMLYVPLAQARQASTGEWRSFYDFRFISGLVRRHWLACLILAVLYSLASVPVMILKTAPIFFTQNNPALMDLTAPQALKHLNGYFFSAVLFVFPVYVALRLAASRIYATGILTGVQSGHVALSALGERERQELQRLDLIQVNPARARHVLVRVAATTGAWVMRCGAIAAACFIWFTFVAQIFISEFFMYHPGIGWLNQPLIQLPWFHYIPPSLKNPWPEIALTVLLILAIFGCRSLSKKFRADAKRKF